MIGNITCPVDALQVPCGATQVRLSSEQMATTITVFPPDEYYANRRLFNSLAELFGVTLEALDSSLDGHDRGPVIVIGTAVPSSNVVGPMFAATAGVSKERSASSTSEVYFPNSNRVPWPFRGTRLRDSQLEGAVAVSAEDGRGLAFVDGKCVWAELSGSPSTFLSGIPIPKLKETDYLWHWFNPEAWAGLLPLLEWLRRNTNQTWTYPPTHAAIIIDDPNLHHLTYGCLDYSSLLRHTQELNYHAAIATIPFDCWYASSSAVQKFRDHPRHLSLVVHGNDHAHHELARAVPLSAKSAMVAQSLRRIEKLERSTGLHIARVMTAPHGACDLDSAKVLHELGYDAACISVGSLCGWNPGQQWPLSFGMQPADFLPGGLPVIRRFGLKSFYAQIRLAAFLGHPLVFTAHHYDFGPMFEEIAEAVNSLGTVIWADLPTILSSCYAARKDGNTLHVRMFTNKVRVPLPTEAEKVRVEIAGNHKVEFAVADVAAGLAANGHLSAAIIGRVLEIRHLMHEPVDYHKVAAPAFSVWAVLRRLLCEARDRGIGIASTIHNGRSFLAY